MSIFNKSYWSDVLDSKTILKTAVQTILGTIIVSTFFMVFHDYFADKTDFTGGWTITLTPSNTYKDFIENGDDYIPVPYSVDELKDNINKCLITTYKFDTIFNETSISGVGTKYTEKLSNKIKNCKFAFKDAKLNNFDKNKFSAKINGTVSLHYLSDDIYKLLLTNDNDTPISIILFESERDRYKKFDLLDYDNNKFMYFIKAVPLYLNDILFYEGDGVLFEGIAFSYNTQYNIIFEKQYGF